MSARLRWRTAICAGAMSASLTVGCGGGGSSSATSDGADSETGDAEGGETEGGDTSGGGVDDVPDPQPSEGFEAGFDVRDISPNDAELMLGVYMGAYGAPEARGVATGVHDPVYARTVALREGDEEVIMTILDLPGLGNRYTRRIREDVAALTGLDPLRILVGATHSHSSPDFMGLWGGVPDAYADRVVSLVVGGMVDALNNADPVDLHVGTGAAENRNRRGWPLTDTAVTVLDARDPEGARVGTMAVFAAHPVVLGESNKEISRDWPGWAVDAAEAELGAPVLLFSGIIGDVSPAVPDGTYADDFERCDAYGGAVGGEVAAVAQAAGPIADETLAWDATVWTLPVDNFLFELAATLGLLEYDFDEVDGQKTVQTQSSYLRVGSLAGGLQLAAFPGESLTRNGLEVKQAMTAPHRMVLGLTGDALGYFIPSDEWMTGLNDDYEESISLGMTVGDTSRDAMAAMIAADGG